MFFGEYEHTIDDKSRLTLPARFRAALADGVVLSKGLDGSVDVYPRRRGS
jgi:MraZ protein